MLSQTRRALEDFDNQHDFERMAADVLNSLGYAHVEPMAPGGGADGGRDIRFRVGETAGLAFVTLDKKIKDKFKRDLAKQTANEGYLVLFCNVDVSPAARLSFSIDANALGYTLEVFDLERLRSLLDGSLKDVRRRYLGIDDAVAERIRSDVAKLVRFPDAFADEVSAIGMLEGMLVEKLPRKVFDLLMRYDEDDVREVPGLGPLLHAHMRDYYKFKNEASRVENATMVRIGELSISRIRAAWAIYFRYSLMRFGGLSKEQITALGDMLNFGITWEGAEQVFVSLAADPAVADPIAACFAAHSALRDRLGPLLTDPSSRTALP